MPLPDTSCVFEGVFGETYGDVFCANSATTQLSLTATPGRRYTFEAKAPETGGGFQPAWAANSNSVIVGGITI